MADNFTRFFKWLVSISAFIYGCSFLMMIEGSGHIGPLILAIFCFGIVYWMSSNTYEGSKKIFFATAAIIVGTGFIPMYFNPPVMIFEIGYYFSWNIWAAAIGFPVMWYLFSNE